MPVSISEQSKDSDTGMRTLARMGDQPVAPGAVVLKQNLVGFQPLQQVAQSVGENTDILFRQVWWGEDLEFFMENRLAHLLLSQSFLG